VVTDETMREIVLKEKKKLFMRLYMIPWISLTLVLVSIISFQFYYYFEYYYQNTYLPSMPYLPSKTKIVDKADKRGSGSYIVDETCKVEPVRGFYKEAVSNGNGEWIVNKEGEVNFKWKPSTESLVTSQVQAQVNSKIKQLQDSYKTNAIVILENKRQETITECRRDFQIEAVNKGVGKWVADNNGVTEFKWKGIPEIVNDYTSTESNLLVRANMVKRDEPFTFENYKVARNVGIDIEGELIKRVSLSIETVFWGNKDIMFKDKVKEEISKSIHGMFDGFESLNKIGKGR